MASGCAFLALLLLSGCLSAATAHPDELTTATYGSASNGGDTRRTRSFRDYYKDPPLVDHVAVAEAPPVTPPRRPTCPNGIHYEPLYRVGTLFLARIVQIPGCPITLPYTKNRTILMCTLGGFMTGMLFGFVMGWLMTGRGRGSQPPSTPMGHPDQKTSPPSSPRESRLDETFKTPVSVRRRMANLKLNESAAKKKESSPEGSGSDDPVDSDTQTSEEKALSEKSAVHSSTEEPVGGVESDGTAQLMTIGANGENFMIEWRAMRESLQELTVAVQNIQMPLVLVVRAVRAIASEVNVVKRLILWMAGRQAKADAWQQATDSMYYGLFVMNMSLAISAFLFGRWQDWGQRCDASYLTWDVYLGFKIVWCIIEEPVYFVMGCCMWCLITMVAFSSNLMKRKDPLSTLLLLLTLFFCGVAHSSAVALLGGSWMITFSVWSLYALFLIHVLESAKDAVLKAALEGVAALEVPAVVRGLTSWESMHTAMAGFFFPVIAGALPFWNAGLSLVLTSSFDRVLHSYTDSYEALYDRVAQFLLY